VIRGRLPLDSGALVQQMLQQVMDEQFQELQEVSAETSDLAVDETKPRPEPIAWRRADALVRLAHGYDSRNASSNSEKFMVHAHTDLETLKANGDGAESEMESGGMLCAETTRRITCDSSVVQWLDKNGNGHDGQPLSVGRKSRTIPPAIRRALQRRDGGCRFPGCTATRFVDAHHIHHWADGGETSMNNLVLLCSRHHHLVHEGGFGLEKVDGAFRFINPQGLVIPNSAHGRFRGNADTLLHMNRESGIRITPKTSQSHWMGEKMDHQLAVEGLLFRE
jgi:hypothetical protein